VAVGAAAPVRLQAENLVARDARGAPRLNGLSLAVRAGEVLGLAGVDGNGQQELAAVLAGLLRPVAGRVALEGRDATRWSVVRRRRAGLAYVPADRRGQSLVPAMTVAENLALCDAGRAPFSRAGWLRPREMAARAVAAIARHRIRAPGPAAPAAALSGGNQQKLALAREVARHPRVLVLLQPCWGLDPGAAAAVRAEVLALREAGCAVLWISTEREELAAVADRIEMLADGRIAA
jgi:simple sugar transport system ATP-binding protein